MRSLPLSPSDTIADFGCSNGFFFSVLLQSIPELRSMNLFGFDHSRELLAAAKARNLKNASFEYIDLNAVPGKSCRTFDIVTCFETLEHVGNIQRAIENLLASCASGGTIVLSVPNELGIPGLLKYVGRKVGRKNPYGNFFNNQSELRYVWHLIAGKPIAQFRSAEAEGWGPHLGFEWNVVENHLMTSHLCRITAKYNQFFGVILVVRKS